jgi:hypothetical protein
MRSRRVTLRRIRPPERLCEDANQRMPAMDPDSHSPTETLIRAFERPAMTVMTVCQMLLGLGLAAALILKIYMLIFTDQVCTADGTTLGNIIRCAAALEMLGHVLIMVAGFRTAALMFTASAHQLAEALLLALIGVLLLLLSGLTLTTAVWYAALILVVLLGAIAGLFAMLRFWPST